MPISTITSKGQVTIPKQVRDELHLRQGDMLDFRVLEDGSIRVYQIAKRVSEVFGAFADKVVKPRSTDEIREGLEEAFREGRA